MGAEVLQTNRKDRYKQDLEEKAGKTFGLFSCVLFCFLLLFLVFIFGVNYCCDKGLELRKKNTLMKW